MTRRTGAVVLALALLGGLTACGGSAEHVRNICGDVSEGTADIARYDPADPVTALSFALKRFDLVEEAVSKARETGLPDDAADTLRTDWLTPAVASMRSWESRLQDLRTAVNAGGDDRARVDAAFAASLALGTEGVDTGALRRIGYGECAAAFTAPTVGSTSA